MTRFKDANHAQSAIEKTLHFVVDVFGRDPTGFRNKTDKREMPGDDAATSLHHIVYLTTHKTRASFYLQPNISNHVWRCLFNPFLSNKYLPTKQEQ